jgi:hypothetical protein
MISGPLVFDGLIRIRTDFHSAYRVREWLVRNDGRDGIVVSMVMTVMMMLVRSVGLAIHEPSCGMLL